MRSLHVVTSDARRGAETFAVDLCDALTALDEQVRIFALAPSGDSLPLAVPALGTSRRAPSTLLSLRAAARSADVVVAHGSSTLEACAVALAGSGVPFVYRSIGDPVFWVGGWRRRSVGVLLRRASRVAALWPDAARQIAVTHGIAPERIDVIPNAVREERFRFAAAEERARLRATFGVPRTSPCFAFVGALSGEKGVATAIAATCNVPDAVLLVAGTGPLAEELRIRADRDAPGRVRFLGQVEDPRDIYAAADLLLLPSLSEGMPAVLVEAALVGTPTVGTSVGAIPAIITDDETGYLAGPPDQQRFVERVRSALPTAAEVGNQAAAELRGRYSMDRVAALWRATLAEAAP
jgi:glycosyltransferase involved in cell wall biosynthesis